MIALAYIALLGAPLVALGAFLLVGATPSNIAYAIVFEWLFLPIVGLKFVSGIPVFDKSTAAAVTLITGLLMARRTSLFLRPSWADIPMLVWCLVPIISCRDNDLGLYSGVAAALRQTIVWGIPYFVGRMLSRDTALLVALGKALLIGAVCYAPLCLIESRLSARCHLWVYGTPGRANLEQVAFFRSFHWKPTVFLQTQLELTPLMGIGTLFGFWLWRAGKLKSVGHVAMQWLVPVAASATILGKSLGGVSLTVAGAGVLLLTRRLRSIVFLLAMTLIAPLYATTRTLEWWSGQDFVDFLKEHISETRADSFGFRLKNEDLLIARALERPTWGWGVGGRNRVLNEEGRDITVTDGLWIIALGDHGIVGLSAFLLALLLPVWLITVRRDRRLLWDDPRGSIVLVAAVAVVMHSIDCIPNAMPNPFYPLLAGCLASIASQRSATNVERKRVGQPSLGSNQIAVATTFSVQPM